MWEGLGEKTLALDAIRRRPYLSGWPRYLATARREEGRLAALAGDQAGALRAYREYLAWRPVPEPGVQSEVSSVRAAEAALHQ